MRDLIGLLAAFALPLQGFAQLAPARAAVQGMQPTAPSSAGDGEDLPVEAGHLMLIGGALGEQRTILNRVGSARRPAARRAA